MTFANGRRVLLVEEDRILRRACEAALRSRGVSVTEACDGDEALLLARRDRPDLVLLDLPASRRSGFAVLRALREDRATAGIPVVVLSNAWCDEDVAEARRLGAAGYLVKADLSLRDIGDHVEGLLAGPAGAARGGQR